MMSQMATLEPSRDMTSFPPHHDGMGVNQIRTDQDRSLVSFSHQQPRLSTHHHHGHSSQQHIPGHPLIFSNPQNERQESYKDDVSSMGTKVYNITTEKGEVQTSLDYDISVPATRFSQVVEEGGVEKVHVINAHHANFETNSLLHAGREGLVGSDRGESCDGVSGGPHLNPVYNRECGDSSSGGSCCYNTDRHRDRSCVVVVVTATCEADVKKNEMGNDLFSARATRVSDTRAESQVSEGKFGVSNRVGLGQGTCSDKDIETRVTDTSDALLHTECSRNEASRVLVCDVSAGYDTEKCKQSTEETSDNIAGSVNVLSSYPVLRKVHPGPDGGETCVSGVPEGGTERLDSNKACPEYERPRTSVTMVSRMGHSTRDVTNDLYTSQLGQGDSAADSTFLSQQTIPEVCIQKPERSQVTTLQWYSTPSSDSKPVTAASHIPLTNILSSDSPTIILTQGIPQTLPTVVSPSDRSRGYVSHNHTSPVALNKAKDVESSDDVKAEYSSPGLRIVNTSDKTSKSIPVGGVKVLPSKFTFNFRAFRESKPAQSLAPSDPNGKDATKHMPHCQPVTVVEINKDGNSSDVVNGVGQESRRINGTSITTIVSSSSSSSSTEATTTSTAALPSNSLGSENGYKYPVHAPNNMTFAKKTEDESWSDYAVPSNWSSEIIQSGLLSTEAQISNYEERREREDIDGSNPTNIRIEPLVKAKTDTPVPHITVKDTPGMEVIYAIPIPRSQRQNVSSPSESSGNVLANSHIPHAEPPEKPPRQPISPLSAVGGDADAFDNVLLRQTAEATSNMKKSTTTDTLHSYSSDYSNIPNTTSRKYDYFSLGRRPKRPRIRTLIDSQGITVSLDMLLKFRRQSMVDVSSPEDTEQTLSVDDILKSCEDFEENCVFTRSSPKCDSGYTSFMHPLTFTEMANVKLLTFDIEGKGKRVSHSVPGTSKPILKKSKNDGRCPDTRMTLVNSQDHKPLGANMKPQPNAVIHLDNTCVNLNRSREIGRGSNSQSGLVEETHMSLIVITDVCNGKVDNDVELLKDGEVNASGGMQTSVPDSTSNARTSRKPDQVRSYCGLVDSQDYQVIGSDRVIIHALGSSDKSNNPVGTTKLNLDYDVPKDAIPSAETSISFKGSSVTSSVLQKNNSAEADTKGLLLSDSSARAVILPYPVKQHLGMQKGVSVPISTNNLSNLDTGANSPSDSTTSFSTISQVTRSSADAQMPASSQIVSISIAEPTYYCRDAEAPSFNRDFRNLSTSSSDIPSSSLSASFGSDSAGMSSPGAMTSLSVDVTETGSRDSPSPILRSPRSGSKLEAAEALKWLRAAGFPQYAQMFDDGQFPVDMGVVERDHDFLDKDSLQSLFRRLETLNKYAGHRFDSLPSKKATSEEEDEDDFCALSERWEYQKSARRWSRKDQTPCSKKAASRGTDKSDLHARSGSHDSLLADQDSESQTGDSPLLEPKMPHQIAVQHQSKHDMMSLSRGGHAVAEIVSQSPNQKDSPISPRVRRAASEKMKTAKNLFKKMDGLKSTKSRRQTNHRNVVEISGPVVADRENMQAKLERLNCVDISPTTDSLPSPQSTCVKAMNCNNRGTPVGADSQLSSPDLQTDQSPQLASSPRPHSDLLLRPKDVGFPLHSHFNFTRQTRSTHTSPTQIQLGQDSNFDEYYNAQTTFRQNLEVDSVRRNNSDTNLTEIFLVPQDHQPGRFPRLLQNGYIETEACGTAVNPRTGSVRLGRGAGLVTDHSSPHSRTLPFRSRGHGLRISVYDNFLPADGKKLEENETRSVIPGVIELGGSVDGGEEAQSVSRRNVEINKFGIMPERDSCHSQPDNERASRDSSVARTAERVSDQEYKSSDRERSVSFESSSSRSPKESSPRVEGVAACADNRNNRLSSPESISSKLKGVTHSSSVDSYFRGSSGHTEVPGSESPGKTSPNTFQQDYDEFDRILQELYTNINDLTSFMDRDKHDKVPRLVRAATSPLPAGSKSTHSPLHAATPSVRPVLKTQKTVFEPNSPSSTTSDLMHSPVSPTSPQDTSESLSFYRGLDLDHENSSSGGEGNNTAESGSEDQEAALTDASHDDSLDQIIEVSRERRDSGVGHSLTRASSDRRHKKIRWHSFQKSHRPDITSRAMQINSLTVGQLVRLQKLSLLKLTGIMEKCLPVNKSGWNWMVPRFMKRHKAPDFSDKNVFGVPLSVMAQRTGQPLPQCVLYAMRYLRRTCQSAVGIFRKSGVKSKIQQLRDYLEAHPDTTNFDGENAYNVADMLKTYFRDLPECLLTNKMSETFRSIYTYVPQPQRLEAIQAAILLLPDENREVLQSILLFLSDISVHESDHQMNASNLSVCFTPTVFHLGPRQSVPYSPKRNRKNSSGVPDPREILEQKAAHECLLMMITDCKKLFTVPQNLFRQLQVQSLAHMEPTLPQDIGNSPSDVRAFGQERIQMVLKESHDKSRGWIPTMTVGDVEVFHRKPTDDCPLKEWKLIVDIEAPPIEVLRRIMHERHTWDEDLLSWSVVERLDPFSDIFQFVLNSMAPHPPRNFCVLRYWRSDLNKGACALITMSVEHSDALEIHGVWAIDLGTYFLVEPCGSGRSRLVYISRVDTRGRMPEWYTKIFGHIGANFLERLKESFKQDTSGPETKV